MLVLVSTQPSVRAAMGNTVTRSYPGYSGYPGPGYTRRRNSGFLLRLIVDEANISINRSPSQSHDTIKTLFVDYDGGLVMLEPG